MPRPHLVHRREEQVLLARNERILRRLVPRRIGRRDIIDRRQAFLIRPRDVDIGAVLAVVRRRFLDLGLFSTGDRHEILFDEEGAQRRKLAPRFGDWAAFGLVRIHLLHAVGDRHARRISRAGGLQRVLIALEVGLSDAFEFAQRRVDCFVGQDHLRELVGADRIAVGGARFRTDIGREILHRRRGLRGRIVELLLQLGILDLGEGLLGVAGIIVGEPAEARRAIFDEGRGQRQLDVRLDLLGGRRNLLGIGDEGLHPRRRVGVGARDIDVRIELTDIIGRVLVREIGVLQEEELTLRHMDQIVALELFGVGHVAIERLGIGDRFFEEVDLFLEPLGRPVGELAVKFMLALIDREIGVEREIARQESVAELGPVLRARRRGGRFVRSVAGGQDQQRRGHRGAAEAGKFTRHWVISLNR